MPLFKKELVRIPVGEDFDLLARVVRRVGSDNELPADDGSDYTSVEFRIYARTSRNPIYTVTGIDPRDVIDALVTDDPEWTKGGGYNFKYTVLLSDLTAAGVVLEAGAAYTMQVRLIEPSIGPRYVVWIADMVSNAA